MAPTKRTRKLRPKKPARVKKRKRRNTRSHHHPELAGLAACALGVFLAGVLWLGLSGGPVGGAATAAIGWAAYVLPLALVPVGALVVTRSALVDVRPFRLGLSVTFAGLMLSLGRPHGGLLGKGLERVVALGIGPAGSTILGVVLALAGVLLLTGASLGALVRRSGSAVRQVAAARSPRRREPHAAVWDMSTGSHRASPADTAAEPPVDIAQDYPDLVSDAVPQLVPASFGDDDEQDTQQSLFDVSEPTHEYVLPDRSLLNKSKPGSGPNGEANARIAEALLLCLSNFGVEATLVGQISGPRVTRYELQLAPGTKVGKVAQLRDDLCYALATTEIRILAPIPGKQAVGVEVPNLAPNLVTLGDIFGDIPPQSSPLSVWLGKGIDGIPVYCDLARMPHLLIAGTTGSGKSGCINAILTSILLRSTPDQVRLILVDPKRIELNYYESVPHLLTPVVSSPKEASAVLLNVVTEMERRYERLERLRARNLPEANRALRKRGDDELPYLLVVIDELADLMMVSPQEVEDAIIRLAQKSRAVGIHLVLATQRPSVDVITGMIKANVPSRVAFAVSSQTDSRVILDSNGAESLLGQGDMLFKPLGTNRVQRIQGAYIDEEQILELTEAWRRQGEPELREELLEEVEDTSDGSDGGGEDGFDPDEDPLLEEAISLVASMGTASTSMLQRRLRLGYTRAGRVIDMLERRGIISGYEGSKPRQVLITEADVPRILMHLAEGSGSSRQSPAAATGAPD